MRGIKRDLYEGGIRVPMIVRWPGKVKPGTVSEQGLGALELFADGGGSWPGRRPRPALDGISMREALLSTATAAGPERTFYWEFHEGGYKRAARRGKWKAVWLDPAQPIELYDLDADIGETRNLAAAQPAIVKQFESVLRHRTHAVGAMAWEVNA